jgi:cytochrome P450
LPLCRAGPDSHNLLPMAPTPVAGELDFSSPAFWSRPRDARYAAYAQLRALPERPFFTTGPSPTGRAEGGYYALLSHADVTEASRNPAVFSSAAGVTSVFDLAAESNEAFRSMLNMDDPRHARLRRIVSRSFTPKMIAKFEADVRRTAAQVVDDLLAAGPGDFVAQVATRLPLKVICDMMGIGDEHYDMIVRTTNVLLAGGDTEYVSADPVEARQQAMAAAAELAEALFALARGRSEHPREDLVSVLMTGNVDGERLDHGELFAFFILLMAAGNETTRNAISHALHLLTEHPGQRVLLLSDLDGLLGSFAEEVVRHASPVIWMRRTLTRDYVLNRQALASGDKVLLFYQAANRDPEVFPDPDRFDITRSPNPHVGFGAPGPHFCLGAHLARREITAIWRELLARAPGIRAADEPDYLQSSFVNGIKRLRCELE